MLRRFTLDYEGWEAVIEIEQPKADPYLKEMVEFWCGWEENLRKHGGDYAAAFINQVKIPLLMASEHGDLKDPLKGLEGYYSMDGTHGIKLVSCDRWNLHDYAYVNTSISRLDDTGEDEE